MKPTRIESLDPYDWTDILGASQSEGHNMVNRLLTDFHAGNNRFDAPGEALFAHIDGNVVVAVAGLNLDPSLGRAGRVRRMYVIPRCRGKGLARSVVEEIASLASPQFDVLTVNVGKLESRGFYEHLGFRPIKHVGITHAKELAHNNGVHSLSDSHTSALPGTSDSKR